MKKIIFTLAFLCIAFAAFCQTESEVINSYATECEMLEQQYHNYYDAKNFNQSAIILEKILTLTNNLQLSESEIAEYQPNINRIKAETYYDLACSYALLHQKKQALDYFVKSVEFGWNDYSHILNDSDLDYIRQDKQFVAVMKKLSENTYLAQLQKANGYAKEDTVGFPHFTYETPENGRMKDVRSYFHLDSIAGNGDEISKVLNIMYWIHNNIRHDGSNYALAEFCSIDLYHYYKATGKGINCRHLAIALNEMYLSMGWKSRYVTCLPKSEFDQDCHVINCVWIDSLQKWVWIDPTFAAYVKDENGTLLSINEVRERLIDGRPLFLNEDANWNNENKQTKDNYLMNYMAKNLYWLQISVSSQFNPESRYRNCFNTYVSLVPMGFTHPQIGGGTITHDPEYFWQKPE